MRRRPFVDAFHLGKWYLTPLFSAYICYRCETRTPKIYRSSKCHRSVQPLIFAADARLNWMDCCLWMNGWQQTKAVQTADGSLTNERIKCENGMSFHQLIWLVYFLTEISSVESGCQRKWLGKTQQNAPELNESMAHAAFALIWLRSGCFDADACDFPAKTEKEMSKLLPLVFGHTTSGKKSIHVIRFASLMQMNPMSSIVLFFDNENRSWLTSCANKMRTSPRQFNNIFPYQEWGKRNDGQIGIRLGNRQTWANDKINKLENLFRSAGVHVQSKSRSAECKTKFAIFRLISNKIGCLRRRRCEFDDVQVHLCMKF